MAESYKAATREALALRSAIAPWLSRYGTGFALVLLILFNFC